MMSMRAMMLEEALEGAIYRFAKLRGDLEKLVPMSDIEVDRSGWIYGPMGDDGDRVNDEVYEDEEIENVRAILLKMVDATHKIDGLLTARVYLDS